MAATTSDAAARVMLHMPTTEEVVKMYYHELPNKAAAIAAIVLYSAVTAALVGTTIKTRAWFMLAAVITGAMEIAGYALRVRMMSAPEFNTYVVSYAFLIIAPVFLAIVEYMCVSKMISMGQIKDDNSKTAASGTSSSPGSSSSSSSRRSGERGGKSSSLFAGWVSWFMVISEVLCLGLQCAAGGPLTSKSEAQRDIGRQMMLAGLLLQIGFFTIFTAITVYIQFHPRFGFRGNRRFWKVFVALYATIAMIYTRNIFRVIEFSQGFAGYLATHEAFFYGFDFAIVFAVMLVFAAFNYGFAFAEEDRAANAPIVEVVRGRTVSALQGKGALRAADEASQQSTTPAVPDEAADSDLSQCHLPPVAVKASSGSCGC